MLLVPIDVVLLVFLFFGQQLARCNGLHLSGELRPGIDVAFTYLLQLVLHSVVRAWELWTVAFRQNFCWLIVVWYFSVMRTRLLFFVGLYPSAWYVRETVAAYNPRPSSYIATRICAR